MEVKIFGEYITVTQFLKKLDLIPTGGKSKFFVMKHKITINNREIDTRNSKIKIGDTVSIDDQIYKITSL
ncbi:s4-like RNA-binding protein [Metamycoplasma cloacale]|uniref:RNA-binding S4 domain-containing protein n=1 Tax=Metamycoplasma cloacale TaxID=92401 RepID=A0A2Z4LLH8_9BACT|nr:RNA-binding S4 domain-containing protein [Metamycoplasma cloacale]AWX42621.1 RNA-binding S4 domain-containing protein [Metamycoplasma cloacale]VEU79620.1 s4-like RNA-binding protein [Metamycoplasma cloacale]